MDQHADQPGPPSPPEGDFAPAPPAQVDRLELVSPSLWTRGMTTAAVMLVVAGLWFSDFILAVFQAQQVSWQIWAMVLGPPLAFAAYLGWRWWDKPAESRAIVFEDERVLLPVSSNSKRTVELAYGDVKGVLAMTRGRSESVLVDTGSKTLGYADGEFERPDGTMLLRQELFRRIHQLPNASEVLAGMRERQKLARIATSKKATVTKALLGILAVYFGVELWMGVSEDPFGLIELGANAPALIDQGQYFRLISANFLHQGWMHIILNGIALLFLGTAVEKLVGSWRMLLIYLLGALGGSLGSYLAGPGMVSVGSSTAIFGLFGAFLALHVRYWKSLPPPFRQSVAWWVVIIGINAGLPVVVPIIDYAAHGAGFVVGGVAAWLLVLPMKDLKPDHRPSMITRGITVLMSAVFVAGLVQAAVYAFETHPQDEAQVFGSMLDEALESESAPEQVNFIAWSTAIDPDASREQLEEARRAVEKVVDEQDDRLEIRDTLATLNYRLARKLSGDRRLELIDEAIDIERAVFREATPTSGLMGDGKVTFASQLARFLSYRREIAGPIIEDNVFAEPPTLRFDPSDDGSMVIRAPGGAASTSVAIYASARVEGKVRGLVLTCLEAGKEEATIDNHDALAKWPNNLRLVTGLVEPVDTCDTELQFWPMSPEIQKLP
ncbi:rhomboid family intramembrane serine protease [Persicimonas caeni]|nr:rhomboid family intramembrane serine protease [Persicimonas caeni]